MRLPVSLLNVVLALLVVGCWDSSKSPEMINDLGSEISVRVLSEKTSQTYKINSNESLLFPNLLKEAGFTGLVILAKDRDEVFISKDQLVVLMQKANNPQFKATTLIPNKL